jgi:hypothetical protein
VQVEAQCLLLVDVVRLGDQPGPEQDVLLGRITIIITVIVITIISSSIVIFATILSHIRELRAKPEGRGGRGLGRGLGFSLYCRRITDLDSQAAWACFVAACEM